MYCETITPENVQSSVDFLREGAALRLARINWHVAYQDAAALKSGHQELYLEYKALLDANKGDPGLTFLLGRVTGDGEESLRLFSASESIGVPIGYGFNSLALNALYSGEFEAAAEYARKAWEVSENLAFAYVMKESLTAAGRYDELVRCARTLGRSMAFNPVFVECEMTGLMLDGKEEEARLRMQMFLSGCGEYYNREMVPSIQARSRELLPT